MNIPQVKYPMISSFHLAKFYFGTEKAFLADFQHATTSSHQMASFEWLGHDLAADVVVKPSGKRSGFRWLKSTTSSIWEQFASQWPMENLRPTSAKVARWVQIGIFVEVGIELPGMIFGYLI